MSSLLKLNVTKPPNRDIWVYLTLNGNLISTLQLDPKHYHYYKAILLQKYLESSSRDDYGINRMFDELSHSERDTIVELLYKLENYNEWIETNDQNSYWVILDNGLSINISNLNNIYIEMKLFYSISSDSNKNHVLTINGFHLTKYFGTQSFLLVYIWNNILKSKSLVEPVITDSENNSSLNDLLKDSIKLLE